MKKRIYIAFLKPIAKNNLWYNFKFIILFIALTPSVFVTSCSNILIKKDIKNTPTNCFNLLWKHVDENYSFFDYKKIDWKNVKQKYAEKVSDKMSQDSLFKVLSAMLNELHDGHVNLSNTTDRSRNWEWKDNYPENFNPAFVYRKYFKKDFHMTGALPNQILSDSIGIVRYGSFGSPFNDSELDYVMNRFKDLKGIIIDVRDNGGGSMANVFKLLSRFVEKKTLVGYARIKNGTGHNDFTQPQALYALPAKKRTAFTKPVVILVNRSCYSATTHFAAFMSLLPQVTLIGDRTGGGGGIPISADLPNGWQYRFSATYQTLPDGFNIENGIAPDIEVNTTIQDELDGRDAIIEKAIEVIKQKNVIP
jgi:Peptidase family S41/Tricorn protease C1 domain